MTVLLSACHSIEHTQVNERTDMPQVHAMNILKALVMDAKLCIATRSYLAEVTQISVDGFTSSVWAIRNSAMQLFGKEISYFDEVREPCCWALSLPFHVR